ncbi:MAG: outer membrane lipoprotein carrier protein LolA [Acidobacteriota bacterium]|nr:outer membrane lipoprotein carrier protein LolA [Acidobacteriota bacterium]MDW3228219.1 outer membrane lipoprotein carrier protein LolA [Acidobacteriota bacterium]MDY0231796.1 outer membrane lipoprotein carrier protein LolA [Candidatus Saccharicenans sp.]
MLSIQKTSPNWKAMVASTVRSLPGLLILIWLIGPPVNSLLASDLTAQEIAQELEKRLNSINTLKADFKQFYYSTGVQEPLLGRGQLFIRRPDRMRWEYSSPEKQIFVVKNDKFWLYFPEDNQLIRNAAESEVQESEILGLLSGSFSILERYQVEFNPFPSQRKKAYQLKLTPREESQFSYILLEIDSHNWMIAKAIFFEPIGSKLEYHFERVRIDQKIPEEIFDLRIPPDCEIIEAGSIRQHP